MVFGAVFVAGIIIAWIFAVREIGLRAVDFITPQNKTSVLNLVSASLCFRVYFNGKHEIKNKLLLYVMIFAYILGITCIALTQFAIVPKVPFEQGEKPLLYPITVYFIFATGIGLILNFIAWKTGKTIAKILAGIAYIFGMFTLISAIMCFISCVKRRALVCPS